MPQTKKLFVSYVIQNICGICTLQFADDQIVLSRGKNDLEYITRKLRSHFNNNKINEGTDRHDVKEGISHGRKALFRLNSIWEYISIERKIKNYNTLMKSGP